MDLTNSVPRSPYEMIAGISIIARTKDKAQASNNGSLGEYHYNCPLDQKMFKFLGTNEKEFAAKVKELITDEEFTKWINQSFPKNQEAKDEFNNFARHDKPQDADGKAWMAQQKKDLGREDYNTYFDNIDADEKRF